MERDSGKLMKQHVESDWRIDRDRDFLARLLFLPREATGTRRSAVIVRDFTAFSHRTSAQEDHLVSCPRSTGARGMSTSSER